MTLYPKAFQLLASIWRGGLAPRVRKSLISAQTMLKGVPVHSRRNHDICACTHPREQPGEVIGGFRFRDVDHMVSHAMIIASFPVLRFPSENVKPHSRYMPPKLLEFRERMLRNIEGLKRSARLRSESAMQRVLALLRRMDVSDRESALEPSPPSISGNLFQKCSLVISRAVLWRNRIALGRH
jgi:hypothetical protein